MQKDARQVLGHRSGQRYRSVFQQMDASRIGTQPRTREFTMPSESTFMGAARRTIPDPSDKYGFRVPAVRVRTTPRQAFWPAACLAACAAGDLSRYDIAISVDASSSGLWLGRR